jgi:HAD superfamily hydrolase (TIGR01509 family)
MFDDLKLIIFDCDGVLVDSEPISNRVLATTLTEEGLPTTLEEALKEYKGLLLSETISRAQEKLGHALSPGWVERFERTRTEAFRQDLRPVTGAAEAVERVKQSGLAICVASQGKLEKTHLTLGLTGLRDLFSEDALFSAYNVPRGKPHPDLFRHAAKVMGAESHQCVVIEDTPLGVTAAVSAEMPVLGYAADADPSALEQAGARIFDSMNDLPRLLGITENR